MTSILPFPVRGVSSSIELGITPTGRPIRVTQEELCSGTYILGIQRSGKSSLLEHIIYQQMEQHKCVIAFDPKGGDLIRNIIRRMPDGFVNKTYLLDLTDKEYSLSFNPFTCRNASSEEQRQATKNSVMRAFAKLWPEIETQVYIKQIMPHLIETMIEYPDLTMKHIGDFLLEDTFRTQYVRRLKSRDAKDFWLNRYAKWSASEKEKRCEALLSRVHDLLNDSVLKFILCQIGGNFNFREAIEQGRIILINLPLDRPGFDNAARVLGVFLLSAIYEATFSFADTPEEKRPGFTLVVDEFDDFATSDYERFFGKGRAFGVKQFLAHQYRGQLDQKAGTTTRDATLTAHTVICMKANSKDAKELTSKFKGLTIRKPNKDRDVEFKVLEGLKHHPSRIIKEFWGHHVQKLQQAAKTRAEDKYEYELVLNDEGELVYENKYDMYSEKVTSEVPHYLDFGFGRKVGFYPDGDRPLLEGLLESLNNLCYYSEINEEIDRDELFKFLKQYGEFLDEWHGQIDLSRTIEQVELELDTAKQKQAEQVRVVEQNLEDIREPIQINGKERYRRKEEKERLSQALKAAQEKRNEAKWEYDKWVDQLKGWKQKLERKVKVKQEYENTEVSYIQKNCKLEKEKIKPKDFDKSFGAHYFDWTNTIKDQYKKIEEPANKAYNDAEQEWNKLGKLGTELLNLENEKIEINIYRLERELNDKKNKLERSEQEVTRAKENLDRASKELVQAEAICEGWDTKHRVLTSERYNLEHEFESKCSSLEKERRQIEFRNAWFNRVWPMLENVLNILINDPIAKDKTELSDGEIAKILENLTQRHALINSDGAVCEMETFDLNSKDYKYKKVTAIDAKKRESQIVKQTRDKYCRLRAQVESEIYNLPEDEPEPELPESRWAIEERPNRIPDRGREPGQSRQDQKPIHPEGEGSEDKEWKEWYEE